MDTNHHPVGGPRELKAAHTANSHAQTIGHQITLRVTDGLTRMVHCAPIARSVMKRFITVPLTNTHTSVRTAVPADNRGPPSVQEIPSLVMFANYTLPNNPAASFRFRSKRYGAELRGSMHSLEILDLTVTTGF
jgi:hypothetical protein